MNAVRKFNKMSIRNMMSTTRFSFTTLTLNPTSIGIATALNTTSKRIKRSQYFLKSRERLNECQIIQKKRREGGKERERKGMRNMKYFTSCLGSKSNLVNIQGCRSSYPSLFLVHSELVES